MGQSLPCGRIIQMMRNVPLSRWLSCRQAAGAELPVVTEDPGCGGRSGCSREGGPAAAWLVLSPTSSTHTSPVCSAPKTARGPSAAPTADSDSMFPSDGDQSDHPRSGCSSTQGDSFRDRLHGREHFPHEKCWFLKRM